MSTLIIFGAKYLIFVLIAIALVWFVRQAREKQKQIAIFAIITLPAAYLVAKISSMFYYDPRPFVIGNSTPLISHVADNGFPSDHTLLSAAIASVVYYFDKKVGVILFVLALLVGAARVLAGVHHSVDIFGSLVIAVVVAWFIYKLIFTRILKRKIYKKM